MTGPSLGAYQRRPISAVDVSSSTARSIAPAKGDSQLTSAATDETGGRKGKRNSGVRKIASGDAEEHPASPGSVNSPRDWPGEGEDEENEKVSLYESGRSHKRSRMSLSCKECKRRKIKCDRSMPCGPCERRGRPADCEWDILSSELLLSLPPTIARSSDVSVVIARIQQIETYLKTLPPNLARFTPYNPPPSTSIQENPNSFGDPARKLKSSIGNGIDQFGGLAGFSSGTRSQKRQGARYGSSGDQTETLSDTEDAAVTLENGVFGVASTAGPSSTVPLERLGPSGLENANIFQQRTPSLSEKEVLSANSMVNGLAESAAVNNYSRFSGAPPMELTKAFTCISRLPRLSGDGAVSSHGSVLASSSRTHLLSIEFDASPQEIEQAWINALQRILRALPRSRKVMTALVELYFSSCAWIFHHLHAPCFLTELNAYYKLVDEGRSKEIDPGWIALLCMVLCIALDSVQASRSPMALDSTLRQTFTGDKAAAYLLSSIPAEKRAALPEIWFQASQSALALAEWETVPRVRSIQTIVLYTRYLQLSSSNRGQPSQLVTWLAGAIRLAQVLGLHLLGNNPETMPVDDPAWPPGKNSIKRESAKRLWCVLVYQDWLGASSKNRSYLISPYHFDTDDPTNVNDDALSPIDWRINPAPSAVLTDSTSDRVRIAMARQVRKVFDAVVLTKDFTYDTVLELDKGYREILESLPDRWLLETSAKETEQPLLRYQRHFALEGLHNRIFRLHRPFSTRGYRQEKYRFSTEACIKSARSVIVSTHNIAHATKDVWFVYSHVMGAALVLFNDLFQAIDSDVSAAEIDSKKDTLSLALQIFSRGSEISSPSLAFVVDQGAKILHGLFRAEESRRVGRAAHTLISASGTTQTDPDEEVETFAEVLQRISRSLNSSTAPHRGTPPPTRNIPSASSALRSLPPAMMNHQLSYPTATKSTLTPSANVDDFGQAVPNSVSSPTPWPFPPTFLPMKGMDNDVLSLQFFQDLGLPAVMGGLGIGGGGGGSIDGIGGTEGYGGINDPSTDSFWSGAGDSNLDGGGLSLPNYQSIQSPGQGGTGFNLNQNRGVGGEGPHISALLDQLGGGW